jgi:poly(3-hydroxybutyrate) depolymerase
VLTNQDIDTSRIYFHGLSNGANVVVNIAGAVDPAHVKGIFAEGTMMSGIGVPDKLNVPVRLIFGKQDNYGGKQQDEWRWLLKESCKLNGKTQKFIQPAGSSQRCSWDNSPGSMTESPMEWFEAQKKSDADIDIWWYEDAAHGMFSGVMNRQTRTWGANDTRYAWTGASFAARGQFLNDFKLFVSAK